MSLLTIERLDAHVFAPSDHPWPETLCRASQEHLRAELPQSLEAHLERGLPEDDPGLWFLERLNFRLDLRLDRASNMPVAVWASHFTEALDRALKDDRNPGLVHFPSEGAYFAAFLCDLVSGSAWNKWYYSRFEGLRYLSLSSALRTSLCDTPATSLKALGSLTLRALDQVLRPLTDFDSRLILDSLSAHSGSDDLEKALRVSAQSYAAATFDLRGGEAQRFALELFLLSARACPQLGGVPLALASRTWARLLGHLHEADAPASRFQGQALRWLLRSNDDREDLIHVLAVHALDNPDLAKAQAAQHLALRSIRAGSHLTQRQACTSFGGVFLLLSLMDRMNLANLCRDWPAGAGCSAEALVKAMILLKCFGGPSARAFFADPVFRLALGIPLDFTARAFLKWQRRLTSEHSHSLKVHLFDWRERELRPARRGTMIVEVGSRRSSAILTVEPPSFLWLDVVDRSDCAPELLAQLAKRLPAGAPLYCSEDYGGSRTGTEQVSALQDLDRTRLARDLRYLSLPAEFRACRPLDLVFSVAAQNLIGVLTSRIPALSRSSLAYLRQNLLAFRASLEFDGASASLRMAPPPFHLVLSTAGFSQFSVRLTDPEGRSCEVDAEWEE